MSPALIWVCPAEPWRNFFFPVRVRGRIEPSVLLVTAVCCARSKGRNFFFPFSFCTGGAVYILPARIDMLLAGRHQNSSRAIWRASAGITTNLRDPHPPGGRLAETEERDNNNKAGGRPATTIRQLLLFLIRKSAPADDPADLIGSARQHC